MSTRNRNAIRNLARDRGKTEDQLLADLLEECGHEQKAVAERLNISQAAVSVALKRNHFRPVVKWIREAVQV